MQNPDLDYHFIDDMLILVEVVWKDQTKTRAAMLTKYDDIWYLSSAYLFLTKENLEKIGKLLGLLNR